MTTVSGFISYSHKDRHVAAEVKRALADLGVSAFMAHDDINVSQQWRDRILEELRSMEIFIPLLSQNFHASDWTAQEVGFALARPEVLVIPVTLDGAVPLGFLNAIQAKQLPDPVTSSLFRDPIAVRFPRAVIGALIDELENAGSYRGAEARFRPLLPYLTVLTPAEATRIAQVSTENGQIWDAGLCRSTYLPEFIEKNRHQVPSDILVPLEFQIEHGERYEPPEAQP